MGYDSAEKEKSRMNKISASEVRKKFKERVKSGALTKDTEVIYRIAGGMPSQRIEDEFRLSGSGKTRVKFQNVLRGVPAQEASGELNQAETRDLLQKIGSSLESLIPRSEARFPPDSVVGSITIEVDGEKETFYFLPDEENRLVQGKPIPPQMTEAIQQIRKSSQRLLKKKVKK